MLDRIFLLSHPKFHERNLNFIIETFINNNYPLQFIFNIIQTRLKSLFTNNKRTKKQVTDIPEEERINGWFLIPYIQKVTDKFKNIASSIKAKLAFFSINKLGRIIKAQKDTLLPGFNKNIVNKLSGEDCDVTYVGQTKKKLNTRISEHRRDINKKPGKHSVITEHRINNNHEFKWDKKYLIKKILLQKIDIGNDKHQITKKCVEYAIRHRTFTTDICRNIE